MLLSAVSVLVVAQSSSEIPEGLMNNPVVLLEFREGISVERVLEAEVYIRRGDNILIAEQASKQLKVKVSRLMHAVTGRRT